MRKRGWLLKLFQIDYLRKCDKLMLQCFFVFKKITPKLLLMIFLHFSINLNSQTISQIINSDKYIYGYGESKSFEEADKFALNDLVSQISITVKSSLTIKHEQKDGVYTKEAISSISTYTNNYLVNARRIEQKEFGTYHIYRYLDLHELEKMFSLRENAIYDYVLSALKSEKQYRINDALRNLYWANILLVSHPYPEKIRIKIGIDTISASVYIPNKINEIFTAIKYRILDSETIQNDGHHKYVLEMLYNDQIIQSLDFKYKTMSAWSGNISVNNGLSMIEFYGDESNNLKDLIFRIEYRYSDRAFMDRSVLDIFSSNIQLPFYSNCEKKLPIITSNKKNKKDKQRSADPSHLSSSAISFELQNSIESTIKSFQEYLQKKDTLMQYSIFTSNGIDCINRLNKFGKMELLDIGNSYSIVELNNCSKLFYLVRSIPVSFKTSNGSLITENLILICNSQGVIDNINFSLGEKTIQDILYKENRFANINVKYTLINFLETYMTAYTLKKLEYIESIFDENALIIVGNMLQPTGNDIALSNFMQEPEVKYQEFSKIDYINRLEHVFENNKTIKLYFEDAEVIKAKKDVDIFGIQILQYYTSSNYSDKGYLFLLVDLRDEFKPIIHVRTWQPRKNSDGTIYGIEHFPFDVIN